MTPVDDLRRPNPEETLRQMPAANLIERAHAEVHALCNGRRRWTMTVPPEPLDSDLLFTEALDRLAAAESQREALRAALEALSYFDPYTEIPLPKKGSYLGCRYCAEPKSEGHGSLCAWQAARAALKEQPR